MSRILRRPMFRGGGKVSSYGNGITAPLVPGYQGGGQIGGGIIYGKPMADGRYGFEKPILKDFMPEINLGANVSEIAQKKVNASSPLIVDTEDTSYLPAGVLKSEKLIESKPKDSDEPKVKNTGYASGFGESEIGIADEFGEGLTILTPEEEYEKKIDIILNKIEIGKRLSPNEEKIRIEEKIKDYNEINNLGETQITKNEILSNYDNSGNNVPPSKRNQENVATSTEDGDGEFEEKIELNAKDAIAQNQALFAELLGADKARGQDIGDMLLRFSGSQGNTVGEKFQNYTRAESAAGPSRSEKIKQTAAGLAINDYVAGKRSKEQIEALKTKIDYTQDRKDSSLQLSVDDPLPLAKAKSAKLADSSVNSDSTIANLIQTKVFDQTGSTPNVYRPSIKLKNIDKSKSQEKLKVGYNLVDNDGITTIVSWDGNNYSILGTIDTFWSS